MPSKPAWEPVLCFRAPNQGKSYAETAQMFGSGALYVDGGRIETGDILTGSGSPPLKYGGENHRPFHDDAEPRGCNQSLLGRYPANVALDEESAAMLDEQSGRLTSGANPERRHSDITRGIYGEFKGHDCFPVRGADTGGAARFFYTAKAGNSERHSFNEADPKTRNHHPTVKPIDLCRWLATLLLPPEPVKPRRLLVPFSGSGSEIIGALQAGWDEVIGIDKDPEYCKLVPGRIEHHLGLLAL